MTFEVLEQVGWKCKAPIALFRAMASTIDERFGPPVARDLDSGGHGPFDAYLLRFPCGLEVALWRFHWDGESYVELRPIDPASQPSAYELYANHEDDGQHALFHLGIRDNARLANVTGKPATVVVMRADDNGNEVEVTRVTSRCEADCLVAEYEARAHKQTYWVV